MRMCSRMTNGKVSQTAVRLVLLRDFCCGPIYCKFLLIWQLPMFGSASTSRHVACNLGITAAAHSGSCSSSPEHFFWRSKASAHDAKYALSAAVQQQQQRTLHTLIYTGRTPVFFVLYSPLSTCDAPGISSQPHPVGEPCTKCIYMESAGVQHYVNVYISVGKKSISCAERHPVKIAGAPTSTSPPGELP